MAQTAAHLVDHIIARVPVRQWVLALPIPLRLLLASQPQLLTPVLQLVQRVLTRFLLGQAGLKAADADSGAVTRIQRLGSAGLVSHSGATVIARDRLPKDVLDARATSALAVGVEPVGGSPTVEPTGPVVFAGKLTL